MLYQVVYKPLAQIEAAEAYQWYGQPHIGMGNVFLEELERTNGYIAGNPHLYACVETEMRRANLNRFPYSLFYVIDGDTVNVLSCFHQHREPNVHGKRAAPDDEACHARSPSPSLPRKR